MFQQRREVEAVASATTLHPAGYATGHLQLGRERGDERKLEVANVGVERARGHVTVPDVEHAAPCHIGCCATARTREAHVAARLQCGQRPADLDCADEQTVYG